MMQHSTPANNGNPASAKGMVMMMMMTMTMMVAMMMTMAMIIKTNKQWEACTGQRHPSLCWNSSRSP